MSFHFLTIAFKSLSSLQIHLEAFDIFCSSSLSEKCFSILGDNSPWITLPLSVTKKLSFDHSKEAVDIQWMNSESMFRHIPAAYKFISTTIVCRMLMKRTFGKLHLRANNFWIERTGLRDAANAFRKVSRSLFRRDWAVYSPNKTQMFQSEN